MTKIPVTGFVFHNNDSSSDHSHGLYITSWDGRPYSHKHMFSGTTSLNDGHVHAYVGMTEPAQTGVPHVHRFHTVTSMNNGHTHLIEGVTGPAIPLPNGGHIHTFEGYTTINGMHPHAHYYRGATGNEV